MGRFFRNGFIPGTFYVESLGIALNSTTRRHLRLGLGGGIARSDSKPHPGPLPLAAGHWAGEPAGGGPPWRRVTEPTNLRARKRQENKPALSTLIARIVPGAVRECDVSRCVRALPFASSRRSLARLAIRSGKSHPGLNARNRISPVAVEESSSSHDPATRRRLRRSPRHP